MDGQETSFMREYSLASLRPGMYVSLPDKQAGDDESLLVAQILSIEAKATTVSVCQADNAAKSWLRAAVQELEP